MKNRFLFFVFLLFSCINTFSQTCPCVRTKIIGNDPNATFMHNNKVQAMGDTTVPYGAPIRLKTNYCVGQATWCIKGSNKQLTDDSVLPATTTEYVVKSTLEGCPDRFDTVKITLTSKKSLPYLTEEDLKIYPNPSNESLSLVGNISYCKKVEIIDMQGKILVSINDWKLNTINISTLPNGTYLLNVYTSNTLITKQFIKQ